MNKTLAIYVETEYLIAAVQPYHGKFEQITTSGSNKFAFYFFVDDISNKIDYSLDYKTDYEHGRKNFVGNFMQQIAVGNTTYQWNVYKCELIELLAKILDDVKKGYYYFLSTLGEDMASLKKNVIPVSIAFSDNISCESKNRFVEFLNKNGCVVDSNDCNMAKLIANQYINEKNIEPQNIKVAVIEAVGNNLNMSVVNFYNAYDNERVHFKSFTGYGTDPRILVLTHKIVDDINKVEGILHSSDDKKKEYERQIPKAREIIEEIKATARPYINVETNFAKETSLKKLTIEIEEINRLVSLEVKNLSSFFMNQFIEPNKLAVEKIDHIILIGNMLNNDLIKEEFYRFGANKINSYTDDDLKLILIALLNKESVPKKTQTAQDYETPNKPIEVPFVELKNIRIGQRVILYTNNTDPNKGSLGKAMQELEYIGEKKFNVISSTRSLQNGDVVTALVQNWTCGLQIQFSLTRNSDNYTFKTRTIERIVMF